jgi:hypothetical protein
MKSKVTKAEFKNDYDSKYGTMNVFTIEFENGQKGQYQSKSRNQDKFVVGKEAEYEVTPVDGYPDKIKPVQANNFTGAKKFDPVAEEKRQKLIVAQSSIKAAVDLAVGGVVKYEQLEAASKKIYEIAYKISE